MHSFTGKVIRKKQLTGGDINQVFLVEAEKGKFVLKENPDAPDDFFQKEAMGLRMLQEAGLKVPEVIAAADRFLLLEYIQPGDKTLQKEEAAGRMLATLHEKIQESFGLSEDNYVGQLRQENGQSNDWPEFYWSQRIRKPLDWYFKENQNPDQKLWEKLGSRLKSLLQGKKASLLHGDIWSGNLYYGKDGPWFIDPAIYVGDACVDLAFTELFGGFGNRFYGAYNEVSSISESYEQLRGIYQIYPLLVHANLFGGSYYQMARDRALKAL